MCVGSMLYLFANYLQSSLKPLPPVAVQTGVPRPDAQRLWRTGDCPRWAHEGHNAVGKDAGRRPIGQNALADEVVPKRGDLLQADDVRLRADALKVLRELLFELGSAWACKHCVHLGTDVVGGHPQGHFTPRCGRGERAGAATGGGGQAMRRGRRHGTVGKRGGDEHRGTRDGADASRLQSLICGNALSLM